MTVITLLGCVSVICLLGNTFVSGDVICPRRCKPEVECEFGYVTDQDGCPTCDCKINPCALVRCPGCKVVEGQAVCGDTCPAVRCRRCRYGYVYDDNNCQTCECKPNPCETFPCPRNQKCELVWPRCRPESPCYPQPRCVDICPKLRCRSCPYGHEYDANGCKTCRCRPNPCERKVCPRNQKCEIRWPPCRPGYPCYPLAVCVDTCPVVGCRRCRYGYVYDANNCQTCECKPNPCETFPCPRNQKCELVWPLCRPESRFCYPKPRCVDICPELGCRSCPYGHEYDANGCKTCRCRPNPCERKVCPNNQKCEIRWPPCRPGYPCYPLAVCVDICPRLMCKECEFGNVVDENGCRTCECKKDPCEGFQCPVGQKCVAKTVICKKPPCDPVPTCEIAEIESDPCPMSPECSAECKYGYKHKDDGCMTCECIEDPCLNHTCDAGQECYLRPVLCVRAPCPPLPACRDICHPVTCRLWCPAGFKKDSSGCEICQCAESCELECRPGYQCKVVRGQARCLRGSPLLE